MSVTRCSGTTRRLDKQKALSNFSPSRAVSGPIQSPLRSGSTLVKVFMMQVFLLSFFLIYLFFKSPEMLKQFLLLCPFLKEQLEMRTHSFGGMLFDVRCCKMLENWKVSCMNEYVSIATHLHFIHTITTTTMAA